MKKQLYIKLLSSLNNYQVLLSVLCPPSTTHTLGAELWTLCAAIQVHVQKNHHVFQLLSGCEHCEQGCSNLEPRLLSQKSLGARLGC